ncbi:TPA: hypothetical protein MN540_005073 [Klebsiella pneumoniae]|nr:hypothetical protein [Klebsiella pneumoniae]
MKGNRADLHRCAVRKLPGLTKLANAAKPPPALYSHYGLPDRTTPDSFPGGAQLAPSARARVRRRQDGGGAMYCECEQSELRERQHRTLTRSALFLAPCALGMRFVPEK